MSEIRDDYDVAIVGAGPAGLAAASLCARSGLATVLFDRQSTPGGRIYHAVTESPLRDRAILGPDYWQGEALVQQFLASGAQYVPGATVSSLTPDLEIGVSLQGCTTLARADSVVLATGALERPFPIPGGTLPGVTTAGVAQALLKSSGQVVQGRTVLAGSGPLLWLVAAQYLAAGASIDALLDTTPRENRGRSLRHLPGFLFSPYFRRGLQLLRAVRGKVPIVRQVSELRAEGSGKVESVSFRTAEGGARTLAVDTLLLHQGVVPDVTLTMSAGAAHRWDDAQLCWTPVVDPNGGTSLRGILVAGDGAGIAGGQAAAWRGVLAGSAVVQSMRPGHHRSTAKLARTALAQFGRGRKFIDALYRPAKSMLPDDGAAIEAAARIQ